MLITRHQPGASGIPSALKRCIDPEDGPPITLIGDPSLLDRRPVALFCSVQCPGDLIIKSYDLARSLRTSPATFIGGFQSRSKRSSSNCSCAGPRPPRSDAPPLPVCHSLPRPRHRRDARSPRVAPALGRRPPAAPLHLPDNIRRPTAAAAAQRNTCVAALADRFLILHASEGGKTAELCRQALAAGKPVYALDAPANARLIALGARHLSRLALQQAGAGSESD